MEKEFVPYELALRMNQLGYKKEGVDEDCFAFYDEEEYLFTVREQDDIDEEWLIAPTFSQAFRWFRENHDLNYVIVKAESWFYTINGCNTQEGFNTYEEAELACLKKLIEIVENQ